MLEKILWKDTVKKNPRRIVLKNTTTNENIVFEIQDDTENIEYQSDTPVNATSLNAR